MRKMGMALFFIIYVLAVFLLGESFEESALIIIIALAVFFFPYIKWQSKEKETSRTPEEDYKYRRRKFKTKIILSIILYIYSCIGGLLCTRTEGFVSVFLGLTGSVSGIVAVLVFASTMHNPLTPMEAEELRATDAIEKGGVQRGENHAGNY